MMIYPVNNIYIYIYIYMGGCIYIVFYFFEGLSYQHRLIVFHWSLSDTKSQVFTSLLDFSQYSNRS